MKRWGLVVTSFYVAAMLLLIVPGCFLLLEWIWPPWLYAGILVGGQMLLLFLSVDTSWRHAKPRQHIAVTIALASFFTAALAWFALFSIEVAIYGDRPPPLWKDQEDLFVWTALGVWIGLWIFWGGIFYHYYRDSSNIVSALVAWLLKGSVLELLIAVPAHVIVRQRGDCSAPAVTGFGIVTGIAIMLLSLETPGGLQISACSLSPRCSPSPSSSGRHAGCSRTALRHSNSSRPTCYRPAP